MSEFGMPESKLNLDIEIKRMQEMDLDAVSAIEAEVFSVPWTRKGFADTLSMQNVIFLVAKAEGIVAGYCGIYLAADEGEITNVAVAPSYRKKGIAGQMIQKLIQEAGAAGAVHFVLEVRCSNQAAIGLYEKFDFKIQGTRKGFYEKPKEDAYIMTLDCAQ